MSYANSPVRPVGGRLVLDFLNTANWSDEAEILQEKLVSVEDVSIWIDALGIRRAVTDGRAHDLATLRHLRRALREVFLAVVKDETAEFEALDQVNALLASTADASEIVRVTKRPWLVIKNPLIDLILASAKSVLADPREISRVNVCSGNDCGWFYLDESRNQKRKWCMMQTCGNRAKARRFYANKTSPHGSV